MTTAERLESLLVEYEKKINKIQCEANVCKRCSGWGIPGIWRLGVNEADLQKMRELEKKNAACSLCGGTGKVKICECCGHIR